MGFDSWLAQLKGMISGARAKTHVSEITRHHRIQASPGYDDAIEYVQSVLKRTGMDTVTSSFAADGRTETYGWTAPISWRIRSGTLRQLEPDQRTLCSLDDTPVSILGQSGGGKAEGQVVHVGKGTAPGDTEGVDLAGRFVLACGRATEVVDCIRGRGAAGLIIYPDTARAAASYDLVQYAGLFPTAEQLDTTPMGFSISRRAADRLILQLDKGAIRLSGEVDADYFEGSMQVLEAWIPGSDPEAGEVLLTAHLCHPSQSANDNASGSGLLLEIARVLGEIHRAQPLRNTVRFVWVPEFNGTIPWAAAHAEELRDVRFVVNLDMVGQSPDLLGEPLRVFRVPNSSPGYLNACFEPILSCIARDETAFSSQGSRRPLHWSVDPPSGGSDHLVFQAAPHGIPSAMLGHDDPLWHTNLDTIDRVDATRLAHVGVLTAMLAALPSWSVGEAPLLAEWLLAFSGQELCRAAALARQVEADSRQALLATALTIEKERAKVLGSLVGEDTWCARDHHTALDGIGRALGMSPSAASAPESPKPYRALDGPIHHGIVKQLTQEEKQFLDETLSEGHRAAIEALLNLCDGTRTAAEIALHMTLDFGPQFTKETVEKGLELIARCGYIAF